MKKVVLIASIISEEFRSFLNEKYLLQDYFDNGLEVENVEGVVTSNKLIIDKNFIDKYKNLKWIARLGSGMEIIDVQYAKQKNIHCFSSPQGIANAVAEHALAMLIALQKNIVKSNLEIEKGIWQREPNRGFEIQNTTIGIIGYGNTGKAFVQKLKAFDVNILVYDKYKTQLVEDGFKQTSLNEIYENAKIVSYHLPLNAETENIYKSNLFTHQHILINTSRGEICTTKNILEGFEKKKIVGACLDVFDFEKNIEEENSKLLMQKLLRQNTVLTPHIAGYSFDAVFKMSKELENQLKEIL